jgi:Ca-activated chloride channel family protein
MSSRCPHRTHRHPPLTLLGAVLLLPALLGVDVLQSRNRATEAGNAHFKAGKAEEALGEYDNAAAKVPADPGVQFNRGAALYSLSRWDEAAEAFLRATEAKAQERKALAFYNLGNSLYQAKKFKEAAAAFKKSLGYDPGDPKAKWNLELALRKKADEDKKDDKKDDKDKNADKNKDDKKDQGKEDKNKDKQAKNDGQKNDKADDKKGDNGDQKGDKSKPPEDKPENKPPEKPDDKQAQQDPAKEDQSKPPSQGQKPPEKPQGAQGQQGKPPPDKDGKPGADSREVEAILDNLERSPKSLEQELAKLRAAHRRPPAKDW